jgi:hypothetical protein
MTTLARDTHRRRLHREHAEAMARDGAEVKNGYIYRPGRWRQDSTMSSSGRDSWVLPAELSLMPGQVDAFRSRRRP